ncbi:hypothetical protein AGMMS49965_19170 [Bacteroidia bacterium]|nr:hypothetical protein AGMMS49965_19170 [Bacteroidia bacterium]
MLKEMETRTLDKSKDVIDYIAFIINSFSERYKLPVTQSFNYLYQYGAIEFLNKHYEVEHCENPRITLREMQDYCQRNGGKKLS